jgi:serine protease Do
MSGFGEIAEALRRSTVEVRLPEYRAGGSGVIWEREGLILTNSHVARAERVQVELWDGRRYDGRVTARDPRRDVAAIRIEARDLPAAVAGDSSALRPGALVIAIGSPLGFTGALSTGVVHSVGPIAGMGRANWIRASVRLAPGNSGGPLADALGRVVGLNTAIVNGVGVAVPASAAARLARNGSPPMLGVTLQPVQSGLLVLSVDPQGAAAASSLRAGDILLGSYEDLGDALDAGDEVLRLQFLRGDPRRVREAFVRLAPRAEAA